MPLEAVVLAAGAGRRFGGGKLLHPLKGRPLLHHALDAAFAAPVRTVTVVVGCEAEAVGRAAEAFAAERSGPPLKLVQAADWPEGLAASLRAGIASLPPGTAGAYVFLADMPRIPKAVLQPLADALAAGAAAAVPTYETQLGHPVLIGRALFAEIGRLRGDRGARALLEALGPALAACETDDPGVLRDIDTREDVQGMS